MMRPLHQILEEMQKLPTKPDEGTHQIADDLLIEALRVLAASEFISKENRSLYVEALISAYNQIEKWYA